MNKFTETELRELLGAHFSAFGLRQHRPVLETIVKAYLYQQPISVVELMSGGALRSTCNLLTALGVQHRAFEYNPLSYAGNTYPLLKKYMIERQGLEIVLPDDWIDLPDLGQVISIRFRSVMEELNTRHPTLVSGISPLFALRLILFYSHTSRLDRMDWDISQAIMSAKNGRITQSELIVEGQNMSQREDFNWSELLWLYIGASTRAGQKGMTPDDSCGADRLEAIIEVHEWTAFARPSARKQISRLRYIQPDDLGTFVRNVAALAGNPDTKISDRMRRCLQLRMGGLNEANICQELGFRGADKYQEWLEANNISISSQDSADWYQAYVRTQAFLSTNVSVDHANSERTLGTPLKDVTDERPSGTKTAMHKYRLKLKSDTREVIVNEKSHGQCPKRAFEALAYALEKRKNKPAEQYFNRRDLCIKLGVDTHESMYDIFKGTPFYGKKAEPRLIVTAIIHRGKHSKNEYHLDVDVEGSEIRL